MNPEEARLKASQTRNPEASTHWKRWGPYLSERQWGTVREDYSPAGDAWDALPFDEAHLQAYRWGEDGLGGISDNHQRLCFALALWNGRDPILKERLYGLTNTQGNHGEDVKEVYYYLDSSPTHSYLKYLYRYPQNEFPYQQLRQWNQHRNRQQTELELTDIGIFEQGYFDVQLEYAKAAPEDILIQIEITNHSEQRQPVWVLPTLWFRNIWSWFINAARPSLQLLSKQPADCLGVEADHPSLGRYFCYAQATQQWIFCENESNKEVLYGVASESPYPKDAFHRWLIAQQSDAVNPAQRGTKAAAVYALELDPGETQTLRLRLSHQPHHQPWQDFEDILSTRRQETDRFYAELNPSRLEPEAARIQRQALAGLLWNKQFYHYIVHDWLKGDPAQPAPAPERSRNQHWMHFYSEDILSMPDKWEYPWFAAWDSAFHAVALALVDPDFAKRQLDLLTREWYMHPNGQLPAYEWNFDDVNPPVHAWATWKVYQLEKQRCGQGDREFLERVFQKLLLNFTWWVNRKDGEGNNIFEGGFLGLDNIGVFDRSKPLPGGGFLEQADGSAWMGMYSLNMLAIALELARENPVYEDIASKFFEHFLIIADAMHHLAGTGLWDSEDGFYYDVLKLPNGQRFPLKVRSMVGLIPMFAVQTIEPEMLESFPGFKKRVEWFLDNRAKIANRVITAQSELCSSEMRRLLAIVNPRRLKRLLETLLNEEEFLSPYGIRSLSKHHAQEPYELNYGQSVYRVAYEPAESRSGMFGGNSNWRGPVWFPVNYLLIESLQAFHDFFKDLLQVEFPSGSGQLMNLNEVAQALKQRLISLFASGPDGKQPFTGGQELLNSPGWREQLLFHEYFDGDTGRGLGASHQTGWTALVALMLFSKAE